ncbi:HEAT repeat domain-containing protein, partial [Desulfococcus sp.]|uniref:HEAT repeat domain-containing protein n=1 Tax=Desulfococcus sp. TaxID=2025834 RepID=UPI0035944523
VSGESALRSLLEADDPALRTAGLAWTVRNRREIAGLADLEFLARSPDLRERLWLARALGVSRRPDTFPVLAGLLEDPRINVAYQACHAMGERGDRRGVGPLLSLIGRSGEWYVQLYAYRAARRLGWHQVPSG